LTYDGLTYKLAGETELYFGKNMKLKLSPDYRWAWVYKTGIVKAQYDIPSDYEIYEFRFYDPTIILYLNGSSVDRNIELGEPVNITAISDTAGTLVCLSINHTSLGQNFTCATNSVKYYWNPTASTNLFNSTRTSMTVNCSTSPNQTIVIRLHSYDLVNNISLNLTGVNTTVPENYPFNVKIYINNSLSNYISGSLHEGVSTLNTLNDYSTAKNLSFSNAGSQTVYLTLSKNAVVTSAKLNITGFTYNKTYSQSSQYDFSTTVSGSTNEDSGCSYYADLYGFFSNILALCPGWTRTSYTVGTTATYSGNTSDCIANASCVSTAIFSCQGSKKSCSINSSIGASSNQSYQAYTNTGCTSPCFVMILFTKKISANWWTTSYPTNPYLDIEGDGDTEWNYTGEFNESISPETTADFTSSLTHYIDSCTADSYGNCNIPITVGSQTAGTVQLSAINITYTIYFNPLYLNLNQFQSELNRTSTSAFIDVPIRIEGNQGNITINDLRIDYNGSAKFNVTGFGGGVSSTKYLNVSYSRFDKGLPYTFIDTIIFIPKTNSSKNVTPYGQTDLVPIYNITWKNYAVNASLGIRVTSLPSCMSFTASNTTSKTSGNITLSTSFKSIYTNRLLNATNTTQVRLWLDLTNCAYNIWNNISVELKSCCMNCMGCW